jgi:PKD repeat protein
MRTIPFWVFLLFLPLNSAVAQQARGLYLAVHGPDAPRSVGDPNSMQALYFDVPASATAPIYVRIFDAETGGNLDARRGAFNTKTRFVILGGASANEVHGIGHNPARNRRLSFPEADVIFDETVGSNNRIDGRYWNLGALPIPKGYSVSSNTRRFVLLVFAVEGDDANYFDYVLSLDPEGKVPPPGVSMFTYKLTLRTPETRSFTGEIQLPVAGLGSVVVESFGLNGSPFQANIPFSDPMPLPSPGTGQWVRHPIPLPSGVSRIGLQFQRLGAQNTFSVMAKTSEGRQLPIPLPILDYEPVTQPRFTLRAAYADTSCNTFRFSKLGEVPSQFRILESTWEFADGRIEGSEVRKTFSEPGWQLFSLKIRGLMGTDTTTVVITDSVRVNIPPIAWAGGNRATTPGRSMAFDGTVSEDPDGLITRYEWDFGDGNTGVGARIDYQYATAGVYTVTLRVFDDSNSPCNTASSTAEVWINRPPVARITAPTNALPGQTITFDGRRSSDPDGRVETYRWTIGTESFEGQQVQWTVPDVAQVVAVLEVVDNSNTINSTARAEHTVTIKTNRPPIAEAGNDKHVSPDRPANYVGDRSRDPDGRIVGYEWIFPGDVRVSGVRVSQGISEPGWHTVYLVVTDDLGGVGRDSLRVRVNHPPVPVITGTLETSELTVRLSGGESTDADPDGRIIRYDWTMGDGKTLTGADITHTYSKPGVYDASLMVTDNSGTFSARQTRRFQVTITDAPVAVATPEPVPVTPASVPAPDQRANRAPEVLALLTNEALVGDDVVFDGTKSSDPDGDRLRYEWLVDGVVVGSAPILNHVFSTPGRKIVTLRVDDGFGRSNSTSEWSRTLYIYPR